MIGVKVLREKFFNKWKNVRNYSRLRNKGKKSMLGTVEKKMKTVEFTLATFMSV